MNTLRFALPYCRRHARRYLFGIALIPVSVADALSIPYLTGEAVNSLDPEGTDHANLWTIIQWVLIATAVRGVSLYAYRNLIIGASRRAEFDLRGELVTVAQQGANLCVIVFNDGALSLIDIKRQELQLPELGFNWDRPDFAAAARGLGLTAWRAETADELHTALAAA